jgi:outer membrane protein assembly factor BamB
MTRSLSYTMKLVKTVVLIVLVLLPLLSVSCLSGSSSVARGWAGTTIQDGIVYAGTSTGVVVAVNSSDRSIEWSHSFVTTAASGGLSCGPTTTATALYATPFVDRGRVYIGTYSGEVYALSTTDGDNVWVYPPKGEGYVGAVVGRTIVANGTVYTSSSDGNVYALNATNGRREWKTEWEADRGLPEKLWTSPTVAGDTLYISTFDGHIYSLSARTGAFLSWSFESTASFASSPVVVGDTIFLGSFDRHLYAVRIGADEPAWVFPQDGPADKWFWASPVIGDGIVYAGCLDGKIYAVNSTTGVEVWEFDTGSPVVVSPVLMNDFLIVTNDAGVVYVFDLNAQTGGQGIASGPISLGVPVNSSFCAQDGLAYIRGEDDILYIVDISAGQVSSQIALTFQE